MVNNLGFKGRYKVNLADNTMRNMRAIKEAEFLTLEDKTKSGYKTDAVYRDFPNGGVVYIELEDNYDKILESFFKQYGVNFTKCDKQ